MALFRHRNADVDGSKATTRLWAHKIDYKSTRLQNFNYGRCPERLPGEEYAPALPLRPLGYAPVISKSSAEMIALR